MDKNDPVARVFRVDAETHQKMEDLRKLNLKHPRMVPAPIRRILAQVSFTDIHISKIKTEWWKHFGKESASG